MIHNKKNSSCGPRRERLSRKESRQRKKAESFDDETDKHHSRQHVNQINCFECRKPGPTVTHFHNQYHFGREQWKLRLLVRIIVMILMRTLLPQLKDLLGLQIIKMKKNKSYLRCTVSSLGRIWSQKKTQKKDLESLEKDKELSTWKVVLEERKPSIIVE